MRTRFNLIPTLAVMLVVTVVSTLTAAEGGNGLPAQLSRIEATVGQLLGLLTETPPPLDQTRLLFPFVTTRGGFDTGISVANTGLDSTGQVGVAGACTIHYFGHVGESGAAPSPQTTNHAIAPGESFTLSVNQGGPAGILATPNFHGYVEIDCAFPFGHGYSFVTDGPIGQSRVASTAPALVLPRARTNTTVEGLGQ